MNMGIAILLLAEAALAVAAGFYIGRRRKKKRPYDDFGRQFAGEDPEGTLREILREVKIYPGSKAEVNGFTLQGKESILHMGEWVLTAEDPAAIYRLVLELRDRGADISLCMEEQLKFNMDLAAHKGQEGYQPEYRLTERELVQIRTANQRRQKA